MTQYSYHVALQDTRSEEQIQDVWCTCCQELNHPTTKETCEPRPDRSQLIIAEDLPPKSLWSKHSGIMLWIWSLKTDEHTGDENKISVQKNTNTLSVKIHRALHFTQASLLEFIWNHKLSLLFLFLLSLFRFRWWKTNKQWNTPDSDVFCLNEVPNKHRFCSVLCSARLPDLSWHCFVFIPHDCMSSKGLG